MEKIYELDEKFLQVSRIKPKLATLTGAKGNGVAGPTGQSVRSLAISDSKLEPETVLTLERLTKPELIAKGRPLSTKPAKCRVVFVSI